MRSQYRLKSKRDFRRVFQGGRSIASRLLVLYWNRNREISFRSGFSISKKVGGAVQRNLVKRRLKSCFMELEPSLKDRHVDFVVIARKGAAEASYLELRGHLHKLLKKAHFMV